MGVRRRRAGAAAAALLTVLVTGCAGAAPDASRGEAPGSPSASAAPSTSPSPSASAAPSTSFSASAAPSTSPSPVGPGCSAADAAPVRPQQLPPAVATTRAAVAAAARACDYAALDRLAQSGSRPFTYSFGGDGDPGQFWREQERRGEQPLRTLVEVLRRQHLERAQERQHVWPAAFGYDGWASVPQTAREDLRGLYGPEDLGRFEQFGAYTGYRVGIAPDGEWLFFVAGD